MILSAIQENGIKLVLGQRQRCFVHFFMKVMIIAILRKWNKKLAWVS